jgi:putative tricarboxylic transport membrane protein
VFLDAFAGAFGILLDPSVWLFVALGAAWGVFVGAMPGIGTTLGYALLIPLTFNLPAVTSVAMLLSVAVGSQFGNSIPAILVGVPGGSAAVMTVMDGYALFKQGKGDIALGASYLGALVGQFLSIPLFVALVIPLANLAYIFQPPELFAMYCLGMAAIVAIASDSMVKGLVSAAVGLLIGVIGLDPLTGVVRFTFGVTSLRPGFDEVAVIVGLLAGGELLRSARQSFQWPVEGGEESRRIRLPRFSAMGGRDMVPPLLGGTVLGTLIGAIPGAGATPAALITYQQAKLWSKHPEEFGKGSVTGIIANEAAQNASNSGELIPTLALGIPGSGSMVILLGALIAQGFVPGPFLIHRDPQLLYAAIAGLVGGTILLAIVGMRLAGWMLRAVRIDRSVMVITSLAIVVLGVYALKSSLTDVVVLIGFSFVGYFMYRYGFSPAAASLAVILSRGFEDGMRHGLSLSDDSWLVMLSRPITAGLLAVTTLFLLGGFWKQYRNWRKRNAAILAAAGED